VFACPFVARTEFKVEKGLRAQLLILDFFLVTAECGGTVKQDSCADLLLEGSRGERHSISVTYREGFVQFCGQEVSPGVLSLGS